MMRSVSPIEEALLDALAPVCIENGLRLALCFSHDQRRGLEMCGCLVKIVAGDPNPQTKGAPVVLVCCEATEAGYVVDLLLRLRYVSTAAGFDAALAVECDGHEFHERTKQQAAYDRARDRELLIKRALVTVRFTGSEIHRDANQCARECIDALLAVAALRGGA